ncbi:lysyl-tRNA synthetase [Ascosphaera pollenicola]|nr:lysyl-tRNA synthetase [Ascosphaera pollenicola]
MAWDHLDIDKPHLAYMILGGFTSLFMLCSLFVKEKLYIGEATVATICGLIFGPHAADLFNPISWGNVDKITLECSRIVLVVQCFAVGVELPKNYMERHWKSVFLLLVPVMTWGWLITSLVIWWMVPPLNWLEGLICAACVTATDPVLASSVVGKGKFAKRVPKHLRDLLSAESGCNDGMAFPFIYLSLYIYRYRPDSNKVGLHWICVTILYECIFGAIFGFTIGYIARHLIKFAERKSLIDRESFLVFYFVLALFCAGSGSLLGMDDLLIGFAAGVGFSNDGWFTEKTEESHVSNVIDLLLNLAYFVYFGAIIPWQQFNQAFIGLHAWRLVVISIFVLLFRRIPIMLMLKPIIPDIKTWREALFAGHFGPIGVGAVFASILARAELETDSTQPLHHLPKPGDPDYHINSASVITLIWPITTFMVITSIIVHGSSIAVFTLGKRINTLTITMSYTTANDEGPSWMNRLPRIASQSRSSMSLRKSSLDAEGGVGPGEIPPGALPPVGMPYNMLRRQREDDEDAVSATTDKSSMRRRRRRKSRRRGAGGPISQSAIAPLRVRDRGREQEEREDEEEEGQRESDSSPVGDEDKNIAKRRRRGSAGTDTEEDREVVNTYSEGGTLVFEDPEGNIIGTSHSQDDREAARHGGERDVEKEAVQAAEDDEGRRVQQKRSDSSTAQGDDSFTGLEKHAEHAESHPQQQQQQQQSQEPTNAYQNLKKHFLQWGSNAFGKGKREELHAQKHDPHHKHHHKGPARAYQFGNTVIVEDEDGEVIKKYDIPSTGKKSGKHDAQDSAGVSGAAATAAGGHGEEGAGSKVSHALNRAGTWLRDGKHGEPSRKQGDKGSSDYEDDDKVRFTVNHPALVGKGKPGQRMSKEDFIRQIRQLDPKTRREILNEDETPQAFVDAFTKNHGQAQQQQEQQQPASDVTDSSEGDDMDSATDIHKTIMRHRPGTGSATTAADARRQRLASPPPAASTGAALHRKKSSKASPRPAMRRKDSEDDGTERIPPAQLRQMSGHAPLVSSKGPVDNEDDSDIVNEDAETPAEKKRRLAALGKTSDTEEQTDYDDEGGESYSNDNDDDEEYDSGDEGNSERENATLARIRNRRQRRNMSAGNEDSDSEDNGEPRAVKGKVQFADGSHPARSRGPTAGAAGASRSSSGLSGSGRRHRPTISWGGERGRNQ